MFHIWISIDYHFSFNFEYFYSIIERVFTGLSWCGPLFRITVQYNWGFSNVIKFDQLSQFSFNNFIGNDGDFLINIEDNYQADLSYVNIINNINLNFFFQFYPDTSESSSIIYTFDNLAFFENKVNPKSDKIIFTNATPIRQFTLENCLFEYSDR